MFLPGRRQEFINLGMVHMAIHNKENKQ